MRNRVEVLHGVNLDTLGRRDPEHYGTITLPELEVRIKRFASDLGLEVRFFQSNHEGEFVEYLHRLPDLADAAVLNAGAWTHYSYAIRDALEIAQRARGRGPPLGRAVAGGVAPQVGVRGAGARGRVGRGPGRLSRGARDAEGGAGRVSEARAERLAGTRRRRGARPAAGGRPGAAGRLGRRRDLEPALADGVQRHERPRDRRARGAHVRDRLPLRGARRARGLRRLRAHDRRARAARPRRSSSCAGASATTTPTRASGAFASSRSSSARRSSSRPQAGWSSAFDATRTRPSSRRSPRRARLDRPGLRVGLRAGRGGEDGARDHARRPPADARAGRARTHRSRRSSRRGREQRRCPHHDSSEREVRATSCC